MKKQHKKENKHPEQKHREQEKLIITEILLIRVSQVPTEHLARILRENNQHHN